MGRKQQQNASETPAEDSGFAMEWTTAMITEQNAQISTKSLQATYKSKVKDKTLLLEVTTVDQRNSTLKKDRIAKKKKNVMNRKERKASTAIPAHKAHLLTFKAILPLHSLWSQYIDQMIPTTTKNLLEHVAPKLAHADFHGAWITVVQSASPFLVGLSGIVIRDTENTFVIIKKSDDKQKSETIFKLFL